MYSIGVNYVFRGICLLFYQVNDLQYLEINYIQFELEKKKFLHILMINYEKKVRHLYLNFTCKSTYSFIIKFS